MHLILASERLYLLPMTNAELAMYTESPTELLSKTDFVKKSIQKNQNVKKPLSENSIPFTTIFCRVFVSYFMADDT